MQSFGCSIGKPEFHKCKGFRAGEALLFQLSPHHERSGSRFPSFVFSGHGDWWEWDKIIRVIYFPIKSATLVQLGNLCFKHSKGFWWKFHAVDALLPMIEGKKERSWKRRTQFQRKTVGMKQHTRCLRTMPSHFSAACLVLYWAILTCMSVYMYTSVNNLFTNHNHMVTAII